MKRKNFKIFAILIYALILLYSNTLSANAYTFSEYRKETPGDFNLFLDTCNLTDRIQMMQALRDLPSDYNTTNPQNVLWAIHNNKLKYSSISPEAIRKALVWRAYNKLSYYFRGDKYINYHEIVQWVADKLGVDSNFVKSSSTYTLERKVAEKYFEKLWEKLTPEQREELLKNMIGEEEAKKHNITSNFFKGLLSGSIIAITFFSGPLAPFIFLGYDIYLQDSEIDTISAFIMTTHMIKNRKYIKN